ncbi:MAG TPA: chalcone isomerase family protein [Ramlibacter sp.]
MDAVKRWLAVAVVAAAPAAWADFTVAGVKYEDAAELAGSKLALNGAGIRTKVIFKVYTAGLYLPKKAATADEVLAQAGAKRISLTMLREVDADEFGAAFAKGIEENNDAVTLARLAASIQRMNRIFAEHKKLATGDTIAIDWVPGAGTQIRVKGAAQGDPIREPEFYTALLRIWLGPAPADRSLKEALLGKPA